MKKWLISFLLLTSVFLGYNKVSALQIDMYYDSDYVNSIVNSNYYDFNYLNDTIIPFIEENFNNYAVFIKIYVPTNYQGAILNIDITPRRSNIYDVAWTYARSGESTVIGYSPYVNYVSSNDTYNTVSSFNYKHFYVTMSSSGYNVESSDSYNGSNVITALTNWLNNPVFSNNNVSFLQFTSFTGLNYLQNQGSNQYLLYYSNIPLKIGINDRNASYKSDVNVIYNDSEELFEYGDIFPFYYDFIKNHGVVVNKVKDLGNNTFGFYQNVVGINATSLSGPLDTLSIICEENKPFINGYCSMNYDDLKNHNSDVSVFNNYATEFTQLFGSNTGYLYNDKYYLYSFRIQKPFVPEVGNVFINSLTNDSAQVNILNVYANDGGSYTDYVVKFKIENTDYNANTNLKDILVVFRDGLGTYYNDSIPSTFNYSVYRSFKLQYFDTEPTINDVNDFYNNNDLSYIDGVSSQTSFFTDNEFNTFGFGGIITAPFRFLYALENYESCSDITVPFPHSNQNLTLTCVRKSIPTSLNPLIVILQVILSGIISYRIAVGTLKIIKDVSSPDNANIEVVDL